MSNFQPEKHLMDLSGKSYLEVKWRLVWFRQDCPGGTIDTEEMEVDTTREVEAEVPTGNWIPNPARPGKKMPEKVVKTARGYARYRAVVTDGKGGRATATKCENAASFPDYIEKAETGAVGRALAMLGYGTQFTGDELSEEHRIVDASIDRQDGHASHEQKRAGEEEEQASAIQSDALKAMLAKAKQRAFALGMKKRHEWEVFRHELTGKESDEALLLADMAKINGDLTKREQAQPAKAS